MASIKFASGDWVNALQREINASPAYEEAAKNWEGDFYFVVEPEGSMTETTLMYLDLWHGKCREALAVKDKNAKHPAYIMSGPYSQWVRVVTAKLDPLQALATGKLRLKGNMVNIMKNIKAAQEIVKACTRIDTEFA